MAGGSLDAIVVEDRWGSELIPLLRDVALIQGVLDISQ
jgi:hypothetical protein